MNLPRREQIFYVQPGTISKKFTKKFGGKNVFLHKTRLVYYTMDHSIGFQENADF
jgi:hypothetical protein